MERLLRRAAAGGFERREQAAEDCRPAAEEQRLFNPRTRRSRRTSCSWGSVSGAGRPPARSRPIGLFSPRARECRRRPPEPPGLDERLPQQSRPAGLRALCVPPSLWRDLTASQVSIRFARSAHAINRTKRRIPPQTAPPGASGCGPPFRRAARKRRRAEAIGQALQGPRRIDPLELLAGSHCPLSLRRPACATPSPQASNAPDHAVVDMLLEPAPRSMSVKLMGKEQVRRHVAISAWAHDWRT